MPRTAEEIISQAEELAARFEDHEPERDAVRDASALRELRQAFLARAEAEQRVTDAVRRARADGHSWASIGAMVGTSGEAARQRYSQKSPKS
jgi:chromatin segregation and condensation protein Rec8/ScpA/Scc1 (kleisin family)